MTNCLKQHCNIQIFKCIIVIAGLFAFFNTCFAFDYTKYGQIQTLYDSSKYYNSIGQYDSAMSLLKTALKLKEQSQTDTQPQYFKIYNFIGILYKGQGKLTEALKYYTKALNSTSDKFIQSVINGNIANIYSFKGDYLKAIDFLGNALSVLQKSNKESKFLRIVQNYHNQGYAYQKQGNYQLALNRYLESIRIANENGIQDNGDTYNNCGLVYEELDSLNKANKFFLKAIKINSRIYGKTNLSTILYNINLASFNVNRGQFKRASKIYSSISKNLRTVNNKHYYISIFYKDVGDMYTKLGDLQQALKNYQQSLISKVAYFNDTALFSNPPRGTIPDMDLIEILKDKAGALVKLSKLENKEANLKYALATLELTVTFIEQLRLGYLYEDSKLVLAEKEHETYMSIIETAYELLNITGDKNYINIAFKYSERSKYAILHESVNEEEARNYASVPDSISGRERRIKEQIGITRLQIKDENKLVNPDSLKQAELKEKLFQLTQEQEKIVKGLEQDYPKYYKRKYDNPIVGINGLQSAISDKEAVISYELCDSALYTFVVTKDSYKFMYIPLDSLFYESLKTYSEFLQADYLMSYKSYKTSSYELYKKLILPVSGYIKGKNLLIIPDGRLLLISFEALSTGPYQKKENADYRNEPYLIKEFPIGYSFSASLYVDSKNKAKKWNPRLLGFAPDYKDSRDSLDYMPLATGNLKRISRRIWGKVYTGEEATEHNFKSHYSGYGIIHFYAHGYDDVDNPQLSKIYLSYKNDTIEDGYLYAYEINEMDLDAELIVLASCYSGSGMVKKGEGVLSIGRSFMNSGTQSLIMSLWLAYYKPAMAELSDFYKYLALGKRKDEALRLAKIHYIESAENPLIACPKYWSGLVVVGNQDALFKGYFFMTRILPFILIVLIVFVLIRYIRKRKKFTHN